MTAKNEDLQVVKKELDKNGVRYTVEPSKKGHHKVRFYHKGRKRTILVSTSSSDRKARLNLRSQVRRMLRRE